ncbi:hypothetical protein QOZ98_000501 [Planomicrobium stackebrandtii]|uniref:Uncharacterized protein n=1 Tax=Planomicrobium stackebrandtii TaxID=253160 RepID=A0ABU0GQP7_9BACL|nr:hypothetical protein [Planomicrobium stackebrandtii]MDQ0427676.1 hypothetical protein [Planomicrobium stackebrandtii]
MIQTFLKDKLDELLPDLMWTASYRPTNDNVGTVYYEGGGKPAQYDVPTRYPRYMVYVSSSDWKYAEYAAEAVYEALHKLENEMVEVSFYKDGNVVATKSYRVFLITAAGEPIDLGVSNDVRDFSINFDVTLTEIKGGNTI